MGGVEVPVPMGCRVEGRRGGESMRPALLGGPATCGSGYDGVGPVSHRRSRLASGRTRGFRPWSRRPTGSARAGAVPSAVAAAATPIARPRPRRQRVGELRYPFPISMDPLS